MCKRTLLIAAAFILAACSSNNRTITMTLSKEATKAHRDANTAKLAKQLDSINYPATVTHDGDTVNVRVGQASPPDVRRAICRQMDWPSAEGKMVPLADTLRGFTGSCKRRTNCPPS